MKKSFAIAAAVLFVALAWSVAAVAADQHSGTWKMNPAQSKYSPGPAAKSVSLKIEADEKGVKIDAEGTDGGGNPTHVAYDAKRSGGRSSETWKTFAKSCGTAGAYVVAMNAISGRFCRAAMNRWVFCQR